MQARSPDIWAIVKSILLVLVATILLLSLVSHDPGDPPTTLVYPPNPTVQNWCGPVGARLSAPAVDLFGIGSLWGCVVLGMGVIWAWRLPGRIELARRGAGLVLVIAGSAPLLHRFAPTSFLGSIHGPGGLLGAFLSRLFEMGFSPKGSLVIAISLTLLGALLAFDPALGWFARGLLGTGWRMAAGAASWSARRLAAMTIARQPAPSLAVDVAVVPPIGSAATGPTAAAESDDSSAEAEREHPQLELKIIRPSTAGAATVPVPLALPVESSDPSTPCRLPGLDILDEPEPFVHDEHDEEIRARAILLEKTFANFEMTVQVVQIDSGPVVTQYEIELEPGLRAGRVKSLSDDLAIALRAPSVRIVAPIPGRNTVGIEVPNEKRAKVGLKEVMTSGHAVASAMRLPVFLGKDVKGQPLICDLANLPHLLIAGRTGTGKSVCLNALILSVLMTRTPEQVRMLMIDPKMVELSLYKTIPHLLHPVVTDMRKAEALLAWAVDKMEERYELLARVGVRHIDSYNKLTLDEIYSRLGPLDEIERQSIPPRMPYILIFADEMADLMMTAAKEVEAHIIRLAQKSRAVGIHLVLATQKPTVDVITGLIKSNLPARIAFQVASRSDSRVVLDEMGADKLLGNGDMLFLYPGTSKIARAQGTYVSDQEVLRVTQYLMEQSPPRFEKELIQLPVGGKRDGGPPDRLTDRDDLYEQAIDVIVREQRGSVSLLQRALGIGYGRGARLIDYMAEDGIVGEYNGSQAREVLFTVEQWEERKRAVLTR